MHSVSHGNDDDDDDDGDGEMGSVDAITINTEDGGMLSAALKVV